jgi:hypothetical protein
MPLTKPIPEQPQWQQAFVKGLLPFLRGRANPDEVVDILNRLPDEYHPLQVYTLKLENLENLVRDSVIAGAKMAGWRFLAGGELGAPVAGHVSMSAEGQGWKMTNLSHGPPIAEFLQAVLRLAPLIEQIVELQAQNYELRMLSIPGLLIEAFWLKSPAGDRDYVVPYNALSGELLEKPFLKMDEFLRTIGKLAGERLKFKDYV